jgi:60 kDa SS-A/Ro ribonucleoprotein
MANKNLFKSLAGKLLPKADARNEAGGVAYRLSPKQRLAQYAATGCLNSTFYADAGEQLSEVLALAGEAQGVAPEFVAKTALYARRAGHMKDMPALLVAVLSVRSPGLMAEVFDRVIDNGRMLRTFVQIVRSGVVGRKSLGTLPKRLVRQWLERRTDEQVFFASVGADPSLADIVKMVHPRPGSATREALYGWLIGKVTDESRLPELVRRYEAFKRGERGEELPDVPHEMLTSLPLTREDWVKIALKASWQTTRMNLNTFARHGVFEGESGRENARAIAAKLRDPKLIARARVFPYQLLVAYLQSGKEETGVPRDVKEALQDALEVAIGNVPTVSGKVWVFPDVSGSMHSPITGHRPAATTAVRCVDAAALFTAAILRRNPDAGVIPFTEDVVHVELNPRDSVMTNAAKMAAIPPGGTNCSAPLALLNRRGDKGDLVVFVSDNQSWVDSSASRRANPGVTLPAPTETLRQWAIFKSRNPRAKLVCLDLQPNATTQALERADVLNVGGFGDRVFDVIAQFADGTLDGEHWVGVIESERI